MAETTPTALPSPDVAPSRAWRYVGVVLSGLVVAGVLLRLLDPYRVAGLQNFLIVFGSLLIEAFPFILLGAVVSAFIEVYVPQRFFQRIGALPRRLQLPLSALGGFAFPVCECGSVPVARRLTTKGLSPAAAVTFMLAAPILNPVVVASTVVAYRGRDIFWPMVLGRAGLGFIVALAVGWVLAREAPQRIIRADPHDDHAHVHERSSRPSSFFGHLSGDFLFMGRYLVIGAAVAAALQTFVPQSFIGAVADTPVVALVAMMALAFVLSLCSESDAFVAASFVQFGVGAQLAFLVFGPMVDTKLGVLYSATFSPRFARMVVIVVGAVTLAATLWVEVIVG